MNQDNWKVFSADGLNNIKQRVTCPSNNPTIWKFVDLPTFLPILTDSCLFFSSINNLCSGDPFECALWPSQRYNGWTKENFIERALLRSSVLPRSGLLEEQKKQLEDFAAFLSTADNKTLVKTLSDLELAFHRRRIICNCWHENKHESDAMWKIYSARTGVAIKSTAELLAQSIEGYMATTYFVKEICYRMERVHYCEESELASVPEFYAACPWMLKRSGFEHEKEIRIFNEAPDKTPAGNGIRIKVNLELLVEQIVLSPFNPDYVNDGTIILWHTFPAFVANAQTELSPSQTLQCGLANPLHSFAAILRDADPKKKKTANCTLSFSISFDCFAIYSD